MGWSRTVTRVFDAAGCAAVAYSVMTRYELGLVKVLPMKAHLAMDALSGAALIGAAAALDDEEPDARATLAAVGAWEIAAALLTRTESAGPGARETTGAGMVEGGAWSQQSMPAAPAVERAGVGT
jgi:hypothetical protein